MILEPGGGLKRGAGGVGVVGASKQQAVAKAEYGVFWRTLSNTTSEFRLNTTPNPPRMTTLPPWVPGLQAKPTRGPKLFRSGKYSWVPVLQGTRGATGA